MSPWIIQDGNYGDFAVGASYPFAIEFYSESGLRPSQSRVRWASLLDGSVYRVVAEVIHVNDHWWAIDCGIRCYQESSPPLGCRVGASVEGELYLGIDPFFYFERLCHEPDAPDLIYDWAVERISREASPLVPGTVGDRRVLVPDRLRLQRDVVAATDAWKDDLPNTQLSYILGGRLLGPVRRHRESRT